MARMAVFTARASTRGQTKTGHSLSRQFKAQLEWPEPEDREVPVGQLGAEPRKPERSSGDG